MPELRHMADDDPAGSLALAPTIITRDIPHPANLEAARSGAADHAVSAAQAAPATVDDIARQLTDGFWEWAGGACHAFNIAKGGILNADISALTAEGQELATTALATWSAVTGVLFNTAPAGGAPIHIAFDDNEAGAFSSSLTDGSGRILSSRVIVSTGWLASYGTTLNSYSFQTYIHEIGHALGLGHTGNYNGSATYGANELFINDSWQVSAMSYFDQTENTFIGATSAFTLTPMIADIRAMGWLYGVADGQRLGNTTYGENSNAGGAFDFFSSFNAPGAVGHAVAMTICDSGGIDTIDLRSDTTAQRIDLREGGISDVYGDTGTLIVALGTEIENCFAGSGSDRVVCNAANNQVAGLFGNDTLLGGAGDDTLNGGFGNDLLDGGPGSDTVLFISTAGPVTVNLAFVGPQSTGEGIDTLVSIENVTSGTGDDTLLGNEVANVLDGGFGNDTLSGLGGNDTLLGGGGDDQLIGGLGIDRLDGGSGVDTVLFVGTTKAVTVNSRACRAAGHRFWHRHLDRHRECHHWGGSRYADWQ